MSERQREENIRQGDIVKQLAHKEAGLPFVLLSFQTVIYTMNITVLKLVTETINSFTEVIEEVSSRLIPPGLSVLFQSVGFETPPVGH